MYKRLPVLLLFLLWLPSLVLASPLLRLVPQGEDVPTDQRIRLEFDRPMIPLGQGAAAAVPLHIHPALKGQWRWTDPQTLSFRPDPEEKLRPATRYTLRLDAGLRALDGTPVPPFPEKSFITTRPRIEHVFFRQWLDAATPVFEIHANMPLNRHSLRDTLIFRTKDHSYPAEVTRTASSESTEKKGDAEDVRWEVRPRVPLPPDQKVDIQVKAGLMTSSGPLPGVEALDLRSFATFPAPQFLGLRYPSADGTSHLLAPAGQGEDSGSAAPPADPEGYMELIFTSPVRIGEATQHIRFLPSLTGEKPPWEGYYDFDPSQILHQKGDTYTLSLPAPPAAMQAYTLHVDAALSDLFGRTAGRAYTLRFKTDHLKPAFYLPNSTAVLEKAIPSEFPLSLTNIEGFRIQGTAMDAEGKRPVDTGLLRPDLPQDSPRTLAAGVRQILRESGTLTAEVHTAPGTESYEGAGRFLAIVSPWQIVAKIGHFNSLIWVTDLSTGAAVPDVRIRIREGFEKDLGLEDRIVAEAPTKTDGVALLPGTAELDPQQRIEGRGEYQEDKPLWFIEASLGEDLILFPLDWRFALYPWQLTSSSIETRSEAPLGHIRAWGLTAQGIYRSGETMDWKLYVRNQDLTGLIPPPLTGWTLRIVDPRDQEIFCTEELRLSEFGTAQGSLKIPEDGAVGRYRFELSHRDNPRVFTPLSVMVTDFSTSPFRASAEISAKKARPGETLNLKAMAALHSGGPYADAEVRIRSHLRTQPFTPPNPALKDFYFDTLMPGESDPESSLSDIARKLDKEGRTDHELRIPESPIAWGLLMMEAAILDDRGKSVQATTRVPFEGRDRLVGLQATRWMQQAGQAAEFRVVVVDPDGTPLAGVPVHFKAERQEVSLVRAKGAGNAYTPRYTVQWKEVAATRLQSETRPVDGVFTPDTPGLWRVVASIQDRAGREHQTRLSVWVAGSGPVLWESGDDLRLELIPEKETLSVGETARILVKNPFPGAQALITVERYGILHHEVRTLEDAAQLLEIPMDAATLPGCYVSVSLLAPRVKDLPLSEEGPDLGKPVSRSGYLHLTVTAPEQRIPVSVQPEKENYKPGETVSLTLSLPENFSEPTEFCVAVLDSAIFDLLPEGRKLFDPHTGLYSPVTAMDVETFTLLTRLLGMQRLDAKGASPAGDGGGLRLRENFRGVAYWNPSLLPDAAGKASFSFVAPDNLTGWEVLVMAATAGERMGTGHALLRVNRPTEIRPLMPHFLRKGDQLQAAFSVFNRTEQIRDLDILATIHNTQESLLESLTVQSRLAPWERRTFTLPVHGKDPGMLRMEVRAQDALDGDALAHELEVVEDLFHETQAFSGVARKTLTPIKIQIPEEARPDTGGLGIRLSPSRISAAEEPLIFLRDYPYTCWEQLLSRAMGAVLYLSMMDFLPDEVHWKDAEKLPAEILAQAARFQTPGGGMAYYPSAGGGENPFLSAFTSLIFLKLSEFGFIADPEVTRKLDAYLDTLLRKDLTASPLVNRTARILTLLARAGDADKDPQIFERLRPDVAEDGLFATALYLEAAARNDLPYADLAPLVDALLARTHRNTTGLAAQDEKSLAHPWLMASDTRTQAAVLLAMIRLSELSDAPEDLKNYPPLLLAELLEKQGKAARWESTQDNLFAAMATLEYALSYENEEVHLDVNLKGSTELEGQAQFRDIRDAALRFTRPMNERDPGRLQELTLEKDGEGSLYYTAAVRFMPEGKKEPSDNGLHVRLRVLSVNDTPVTGDDLPPLSRGDRIRLACDISSTQDLHFIMAEIPLPAGLEAVNPHLATSLSTEEKPEPELPENIRNGSPWPFYHQEMGQKAVRFFTETLPSGNWRLSFTAQAIAEGHFQMPAAHAQALYRPEIWGRHRDGELHIGSWDKKTDALHSRTEP